MANRYWRGGSGSWTSANTANWSSSTNACKFTASRVLNTATQTNNLLNVTAVTSGAIEVGMTVWHTTNTAIGTITAFGTGTGGIGTYVMSASSALSSRAMSSATIGASVPTTSDPVFFDADSNVGTTAFTVTVSSAGGICGGFSANALSTTMTWAGTIAMTIAGNLLLPTSNFTRTYSGAITFTNTGTITSNGVSFANTFNFNGAGQTFTLGGSLINGSAITLTAGTLSLQTFTLTGSSFASSNTNTRSIAFGTGKIVSTGSTAPWNVADWTNFTLTGTPVFEKTTTTTGTISHGPTTGNFDYSKAINVQSSGNIGGTYSGQFRNFQAGGTINLSTRVMVSGNILINIFSSGVQTGVNFTLTGGPDGLTQQLITTNNCALSGFNGNVNIVLGSDLILSGGANLKIDTAGFNFSCDFCNFLDGSQLRNSTIQVRQVAVASGVNAGTSKIVLISNLSNGSLSGDNDISTTTQLYDVVLSTNISQRITQISGNISFNRFSNESTVPHTVTFYNDSEQGGQFYSFVNFDASGTQTEQLTLTSGSGGSTATLTQASGTVNVSYDTIVNLTASGGATWNAFTSNGNIDGGSNTGWNFTAPFVSNTSNFFAILKRR